jgi:endonuclease/exonuclease/phosphatase family metal-dependent hydrolase
VVGRCAEEPDEFKRNLIALGDFNTDRVGDDYWHALASTGLGAPKELEDVPRSIVASSGGTEKFYDQIAWFQDGDLAKLTLEYQTAGYFRWTDFALQGAKQPTKKARISDHYRLWAAFSLD